MTTAAWVAGTVRARALVRRRLGSGGARALIATATFQEALETLAQSPYGGFVHAGDDPETAAHGVATTLLWNVRVLAGWLPAGGAELLRVLAGWFEMANVEEHLRALSGSGSPATATAAAQPPYQLGSLATTWPRLSAATSPDEVRSVLAGSPWHDPGGSTARDIAIGLRLSWADRVASRVGAARAWAHGAAALLIAREVLARGESLSDGAQAAARRVLGPEVAVRAGSVAELRASIPHSAAWALDGVNEPEQLWLAEATWWRRVRSEAAGLVARGSFGEDPVVGAVAMLAHDAWLVTGALAGVGRDQAVEVFDVIA